MLPQLDDVLTSLRHSVNDTALRHRDVTDVDDDVTLKPSSPSSQFSINNDAGIY